MRRGIALGHVSCVAGNRCVAANGRQDLPPANRYGRPTAVPVDPRVSIEAEQRHEPAVSSSLSRATHLVPCTPTQGALPWAGERTIAQLVPSVRTQTRVSRSIVSPRIWRTTTISTGRGASTIRSTTCPACATAFSRRRDGTPRTRTTARLTKPIQGAPTADRRLLARRAAFPCRNRQDSRRVQIKPCRFPRR